MPRAAAWEKLRDISLAHHYVPGIIRSEVLEGPAEGVGASRRVYRSGSNYIQETVEEWREKEGFLIRLHRGDRSAPPFRRASFRYRLSDGEAGDTRLTASLTYEMPWGNFGRWLESLLKKPVAATVRDVALAMKLYYESGEPTSAEALQAYKASLKKQV